MDVSEFIRSFRSFKNEQLDVIEVRKYINAKTLLELDNSDQKLMNELLYIIACQFEEVGEVNELFSMVCQICKTVTAHIQVNALNNLCVFLFTSNLIDSAKKVAKFILHYFQIESPQIYAISHLNMARIYYIENNYKKCLQMTEKALIKYEPYIFKEMKTYSLKFQKNIGDIIILLNGYLFYGKCIQNLQLSGQYEEVEYNKFFLNGLKLCKKYLPPNHHLQKVFSINERSTIRRGISNYVVQKKSFLKQANVKKLYLQTIHLLQFLKIGKPQYVKKPTVSQKQFLVRQIEKSQESQRKSTRLTKMQSPKVIRDEKSSLDIEQIIQRKFDAFMTDPKRQEPKLVDLERKVDELTKENQIVQQQRSEREREIQELKERIVQLTNESNKIKIKLQEHDAMEQQKNYDQASPISMVREGSFGKMVQSMKKTQVKSRGNTSEINNIISNLNMAETEDIKESHINSISINDSYLIFDQNLTIIDQSDNSKQYLIQIQTDITISKKIMIDSIVYAIRCCMIQRQKELQLKIAVIQEDNKDNERIEYVEVSILKELIQYIEYYKVLPYTTPLKTIANFKLFIQYLILPFIAISKEDDMKIQIFSYPQSILQELEKIYLWEEQCSISLYYLEQNIFRLVLQQNNNNNNNKSNQQAFIDLQFDQSSVELFFENCNTEEYEKEDIQEMLRLSDRLERSNDTVKMKHKYYSVQSYLMRNSDRFMQFLEKIKLDLMNFFQKNFNIEKISDLLKILSGSQATLPNRSQANIQLCLIKIWDKAVYQRIIVVADNSREQCYEILMINGFETFAPKGMKTNAEGAGQYSYNEITKNFGLNPSNLDGSDIYTVCYILAQLFSLNIFNKELDQDDYDRFKVNSIIEVDLQCECCLRQYISSQNYKIPLTMSFLGINNIPLGIRIQIFDDYSINEQGMFLTISSNVWESVKSEVAIKQGGKKEKAKKYLVKNKLTTEYNLSNLLNKIGWDVIRDKIQIQSVNNRFFVSRQLNNKMNTNIDRLENIFNSLNLIELLTKRSQ